MIDTTLTVDHFLQLPIHDYMDLETGRLPDNHRLMARVLWNGTNYIVFEVMDVNGRVYESVCRWPFKTDLRNQLWLHAERECRRLVSVLEAVIVRDNDWKHLPVKVKARGETCYAPLYSHQLDAVRYPMLGLTDGGECGAVKRLMICEWLTEQGFDADVTQGVIMGVIDNVMEDAERRDTAWRQELSALAALPQTMLAGQR